MSQQQTLKPVQLLQQLVETLFSRRLKLTGFQTQLYMIQQQWNDAPDHEYNIQNNISIQIEYQSNLVEEWTIQYKGKLIQVQEENIHNVQGQLQGLINELMLIGFDTDDLMHSMLINQKDKRTDWLRVNLLKVKQFYYDKTDWLLTVSVAFLPRLQLLQEMKPQVKGRPKRFLSDDLDWQDNLQSGHWSDRNLRKRSHDLSKHHLLKGQTPAQTILQKSYMVNVFSKKEDVEFLSSPEEAEKIINDTNDDFEIQMIILDQDLKQAIGDQKQKLLKNSYQIAEVFDFIHTF